MNLRAEASAAETRQKLLGAADGFSELAAGRISTTTIVRPSGEWIEGGLLSGDIDPDLKEPCTSMLIHSTPDSSCLLYWLRRMKISRTEELLPFTQLGNRLVELICDGSDW